MIKVYKSIDDFKIVYQILYLLHNALAWGEGEYNILVAETNVPSCV